MYSPAFRARPLHALAAALAVIAVSLAVAAPRASADQPVSSGNPACNYDGRTYYACLSLQYLGFFWWNGSPVLHVNLPEQYGREVVDCGADFRASLWGNDGSGGIDSEDDFIRNLVLAPGWPQANASGIEAHFTTENLSADNLDEDDGTDELYVRMSYFDCHTGLTRTFISDDMVGEFRR